VEQRRGLLETHPSLSNILEGFSAGLDKAQSMTNPSPIELLVVDDNEANRYALSRTLSKRGVQVSEASTGCKALQMAHRRPHLVLMDIHLPDMTAYDVLEKLRAQEETRSLPVILMSAIEPAPHARSMAQALGVHSFLTLPVLSEDLWIVIQAALHKHADGNR
jgi:CheY-like chemotaxis protein